MLCVCAYLHVCVPASLMCQSVREGRAAFNFGIDGLRRKGSHTEAVSMIRKHVNHERRER